MGCLTESLSTDFQIWQRKFPMSTALQEWPRGYFRRVASLRQHLQLSVVTAASSKMSGFHLLMSVSAKMNFVTCYLCGHFSFKQSGNGKDSVGQDRWNIKFCRNTFQTACGEQSYKRECFQKWHLIPSQILHCWW